ncbi:MAG: D-glycero-beta-D-manno-heptose 1-phosphate adenylyltransferase [Chloroflexota bacterium]
MRAHGKRLVLTNGCFDLLHSGHVRYLEEARALGDALAVAINSDASVRRLKGAGRPINTAEDRARVIAALQAVDWVVVFEEDTAAELVAEVQPAVYAKGGDYDADPDSERFPVEGHVARSYGGEVRIIPYVEGKSTSGTLARLRGERPS